MLVGIHAHTHERENEYTVYPQTVVHIVHIPRVFASQSPISCERHPISTCSHPLLTRSHRSHPAMSVSGNYHLVRLPNAECQNHTLHTDHTPPNVSRSHPCESFTLNELFTPRLLGIEGHETDTSLPSWGYYSNPVAFSPRLSYSSPCCWLWYPLC